MSNLTPISASNPIFAPLLNGGQNALPSSLLGGLTPQQYVQNAVTYINESPLLVAQINDLSSKNWTLNYPAPSDNVTGDLTKASTSQIFISDLTGGTPQDQLTSWAAIPFYTGILAHELGIAEDPQMLKDPLSVRGNSRWIMHYGVNPWTRRSSKGHDQYLACTDDSFRKAAEPRTCYAEERSSLRG